MSIRNIFFEEIQQQNDGVPGVEVGNQESIGGDRAQNSFCRRLLFGSDRGWVEKN